MSQRKVNILLPLVLASILALGMFLGTKMNPSSTPTVPTKSIFNFSLSKYEKIKRVLDIIDGNYVDTVNVSKLEEEGIYAILKELDPHSAYYTAEQLTRSNEDLQGNFEGVGIEFYILEDTILVVTAIPGGPSDDLGIMSGDKIIKIEQDTVAGSGIKNSDVIKSLRGPKGTEVNVSIMRSGKPKLIEFAIKRGKIPLNSMDVVYMVDENTGYMKFNKFSATTQREMIKGLDSLNSLGMKDLILDLRGNPGGYLTAAIAMVDELLDGRRLAVYTEGRARSKKEYFTSQKGRFEVGNVVVLIDEGSASASEIVSGAIQDWDRGTVIGRRSFGKGLVQEPVQFSDGSALRLTVSRYYTPTGRSIQKPYEEGTDAYRKEVGARYKDGELQGDTDFEFADSLKFTTPGGKTVYGGGGIMPDIYVPIDTNGFTDYLTQISAKGVIQKFVHQYANSNEKKLKKFESADDFVKNFEFTDKEMSDFKKRAEKEGVEFNAKQYAESKDIIEVRLKALVARRVYRNEGYFRVIHTVDNTFVEAVNYLNNTSQAKD